MPLKPVKQLTNDELNHLNKSLNEYIQIEIEQNQKIANARKEVRTVSSVGGSGMVHAVYGSALRTDTTQDDALATIKKAKSKLVSTLTPLFENGSSNIESYINYFLADRFCSSGEYTYSFSYLSQALGQLTQAELIDSNTMSGLAKLGWGGQGLNKMLADNMDNDDNYKKTASIIKILCTDDKLYSQLRIAQLVDLNTLKLMLKSKFHNRITNTIVLNSIKTYLNKYDGEADLDMENDLTEILISACKLENINAVLELLTHSSVLITPKVKDAFAIKTYDIFTRLAPNNKQVVAVYSHELFTPERLILMINENQTIDEKYLNVVAEIFFKKNPSGQEIKDFMLACKNKHIKLPKIYLSIENCQAIEKLIDGNLDQDLIHQLDDTDFVRLANHLTLTNEQIINKVLDSNLLFKKLASGAKEETLNKKITTIIYDRLTSYHSIYSSKSKDTLIDKMNLNAEESANILKHYSAEQLIKALEHNIKDYRRYLDENKKIRPHVRLVVSSVNGILNDVKEKNKLAIDRKELKELIVNLMEVYSYHYESLDRTSFELDINEILKPLAQTPHTIEIIKDLANKYDYKNKGGYDKVEYFAEKIADGIVQVFVRDYEFKESEGYIKSTEDLTTKFRAAGDYFIMALSDSKTASLYGLRELKNLYPAEKDYFTAIEKLIPGVLANVDKFTDPGTHDQLVEIINFAKNQDLIPQAAAALFKTDKQKLVDLFEFILVIRSEELFFDSISPEIANYLLNEFVNGHVGKNESYIQQEYLSSMALTAYIDDIQKNEKNRMLVNMIGMGNIETLFSNASYDNKRIIIEKLTAVDLSKLDENQLGEYGRILTNLMQDPVTILRYLDPEHALQLNQKLTELKSTGKWIDARENTVLGKLHMLGIIDQLSEIFQLNKLEHEEKRFASINDQIALGLFLNINTIEDNHTKSQYEAALSYRIIDDINAARKNSFVTLCYDDVYASRFASMVFDNISLETDKSLLSDEVVKMLLNGIKDSKNPSPKQLQFLADYTKTDDLLSLIRHHYENGNTETAEKLLITLLHSVNHLLNLNKDYHRIHSTIQSWPPENCRTILEKLYKKSAFSLFFTYLLSREDFKRDYLGDIDKFHAEASAADFNLTSAEYISKIDPEYVFALLIDEDALTNLELLTPETINSLIGRLSQDHINKIYEHWKSKIGSGYNMPTICFFFLRSGTLTDKLIESKSIGRYLLGINLKKQSPNRIDMLSDQAKMAILSNATVLLDLSPFTAAQLNALTKDLSTDNIRDLVSKWSFDDISALPRSLVLAILGNEDLVREIITQNKLFAFIPSIQPFTDLSPDEMSSINKHARVELFKKPEYLSDLIDCKNDQLLLALISDFKTVERDMLDQITHAVSSIFTGKRDINYSDIFTAWNSDDDQGQPDSFELKPLNDHQLEFFALKLLFIARPEDVIEYLMSHHDKKYCSKMAVALISEMKSPSFFLRSTLDTISNNTEFSKLINAAIKPDGKNYLPQALMKLSSNHFVIVHIIKHFNEIFSSNNTELITAILSSPKIINMLSDHQLDMVVRHVAANDVAPNQYAAIIDGIYKQHQTSGDREGLNNAHIRLITMVPIYLQSMPDKDLNGRDLYAISKMCKDYCYLSKSLSLKTAFELINQHRKQPKIQNTIVDLIFKDDILFSQLCHDINGSNPSKSAAYVMSYKLSRLTPNEFKKQLYDPNLTNNSFKEAIVKNKIQLKSHSHHKIAQPLRDREEWKDSNPITRAFAYAAWWVFGAPKSMGYEAKINKYEDKYRSASSASAISTPNILDEDELVISSDKSITDIPQLHFDHDQKIIVQDLPTLAQNSQPSSLNFNASSNLEKAKDYTDNFIIMLKETPIGSNVININVFDDHLAHLKTLNNQLNKDSKPNKQAQAAFGFLMKVKSKLSTVIPDLDNLTSLDHSKRILALSSIVALNIAVTDYKQFVKKSKREGWKSRVKYTFNGFLSGLDTYYEGLKAIPVYHAAIKLEETIQALEKEAALLSPGSKSHKIKQDKISGLREIQIDIMNPGPDKNNIKDIVAAARTKHPNLDSSFLSTSRSTKILAEVVGILEDKSLDLPLLSITIPDLQPAAQSKDKQGK